MENKIQEETEKLLKKIVDEKTLANNIDGVYKLVKINKMLKEEDNMYGNYGEYNGRGPGHGSYGRENYGEYGNYGEGSYGEYGRGNYGRRGVDRRYRGHDHLDRMYSEYGRYNESRERYGAGEETDKSFHYMVKALEDFIKVLEEEAESPAQKQQLRQALQNSMR